MGKFGKEFKINRYYYTTTDNWESIGGIPTSCRPQRIGRPLVEAGTGQRRLTTVELAELRYRLEVDMLVQRLSPFLTSYAIVSAEANLPDSDNDLHWTDGVDDKELSDFKTNRCTFNVRHGESLRCRLEFFGKNIVDHGKTVAWDIYEDRTLTFKNISKLQFGGVVLTNWKEIIWGVNNNVAEESLGTQPKPADIEDLQADYEFTIVISREDASKLGDIGEIKGGLVQVTDNQATPEIKTFTFSEGRLSLSRIEVPGLGYILERLELKPRKLVIS